MDGGFFFHIVVRTRSCTTNGSDSTKIRSTVLMIFHFWTAQVRQENEDLQKQRETECEAKSF